MKPPSVVPSALAALHGWGPPVTTWGLAAADAASCAWISSGLATDSVLSPSTPCTSPAIAESSDGAWLFAIALVPSASATRENEVANAADSAPAVAVTGIDSEFALTGPGVSPWASSEDSTACTACGVAPNRCANCAGVRYWRYSGDPGVDTSVANAASPAGSWDWSVTVTCICVVAGTAATRRAPSGTAGADPSRTGPAAIAGEAMSSVAPSAHAATSAPALESRPIPGCEASDPVYVSR